MYEKIIVVTRKTRLQELVEKFNTLRQAKFYIEHAGGDFADYQTEESNYRASLELVQQEIAKASNSLKVQFVDREFLPNFLFSEKDLVLALGQDGLVANVAKYVGSQPVLGVNPDPARFDGILVPIRTQQVAESIRSVVNNAGRIKSASLAEVILRDGQRLLAFNDLFIGCRTHVSARYRLQIGQQSEIQSSSGIIVSTAAGSTGWLSSVFNMVNSVSSYCGQNFSSTDPRTGRHQPLSESTVKQRMNFTEDSLCFVVREPFISKHSSANIVIGLLRQGQELVVESRMPAGGTIFSDGIENDFIAFDSGMIARIRAAEQKARLVLPPVALKRVS